MHCNLQEAVVIGGLDMQAQAKALARRPHVVVATPGRLRVRLLGFLVCAPGVAGDTLLALCRGCLALLWYVQLRAGRAAHHVSSSCAPLMCQPYMVVLRGNPPAGAHCCITLHCQW